MFPTMQKLLFTEVIKALVGHKRSFKAGSIKLLMKLALNYLEKNMDLMVKEEAFLSLMNLLKSIQILK